jgi:hypothetical protein
MLIWCNDGLTATAPATFLRSLQPCSGPLPDEITLELRQCPKKMEDQATAGGRGVNVFGDGPEADAFALQFGDDLNQMFHRPTETVELPDREGVAVTRITNSLNQAGPIGLHTRCLVLEQLLAARLPQGADLQRSILVPVRPSHSSSLHFPQQNWKIREWHEEYY